MLGVKDLPYSISFGLSREVVTDGKLNPHAWTASGPVAVTGGDESVQFTVVGMFSE
jgi:hypothetical protein